MDKIHLTRFCATKPILPPPQVVIEVAKGKIAVLHLTSPVQMRLKLLD
jgi:hypothetical protein